MACLRIDKQAGVDRLILLCVSRLIVNQVNGKLEAKEQGMIDYLMEFKTH